MRYDFDLSSLTCCAASPYSHRSLPRGEAIFNIADRDADETSVLMRDNCCLSGLAWPMYLPGASIYFAMGRSLLLLRKSREGF